jgi:hypothetical protein
MPAKKKVTKKSTTKKSTTKKPLLTNKQKEEFKVEGKKVVSKVKQLIKEGNVRKIVVKDNKGKVILSLPVNAGVLGAIFVPPLIVVGAVAALITECTITVERK